MGGPSNFPDLTKLLELDLTLHQAVVVISLIYEAYWAREMHARATAARAKNADRQRRFRARKKASE